MQELNVLKDEIENCTKCNLSEIRSPVPFASGERSQGRLMLVAESPDSEAQLFGRPLPGKEGLIIKKALSRAGFAEDEVHWTYLLKCWERMPTGPHVRACSPAYLQKELLLQKPKAIVAFGPKVYSHLMGIKPPVPMKNLTERFYHKDGVIIVPYSSPLIILRWPKAVFENFVLTLTELKDMMNA